MSGEFTFTVENFEKLLESMLTLKPKQLNTKIDKVQRMLENNNDIESDKILKVFNSEKSNGLKRGRNSWQIFLAEQSEKIEAGKEGKLEEASKIWGMLSDEEKKPYIEAAKKESEKYKAEKEELLKLSNENIDENKKLKPVKYDKENWGELDELNWTRYENDDEFWEYAENDEKYIVREGKTNGKVKITDKKMKTSKAVKKSLALQIEKKETLGFSIVA